MSKQPTLRAQQQQQQSLSDALKDGWNSWRYRISFRSSSASGSASNASSLNKRFNLRLRKSLPVWLLGAEYSVANDAERLLEDLSHLVHLTYRRQIQPPMVSAATGRVYRTDAGWGCMYRCAQMLLAAALTRLAKLDAKQFDAELFADDGRLSLAALLSGCGRQPGDWSGPATACRAAMAAVTLSADAAGSQSVCSRLRVHVAPDSCVCRDRLLTVWTASDGVAATEATEDCAAGFEDSVAGQQQQPPLLLLLLPLRLGGGSLAHADHLPALQALLRQPSCLGMLGGRPRRSLYFCGYQGDRLLGLDPHDRCVRDWRAQLRTSRPRLVPYRRLDPSCAVGFLIADQAELDRLLACLGAECRGVACVVQSARELWPPPGVTVTSLVVSEEGSCYADVGGYGARNFNDNQDLPGNDTEGIKCSDNDDEDENGIVVGASASEFFQLPGVLDKSRAFNEPREPRRQKMSRSGTDVDLDPDDVEEFDFVLI